MLGDEKVEARENIVAEVELVEVVNQMLGGSKIFGAAGEWEYSNLNSPGIIDLNAVDGTALYTFDAIISLDEIKLLNLHREAQRGQGTSSLKTLEAVFEKVGQKRHKKVIVIFPTFGQEDTSTWLLKNKYVPEIIEGKSYYYKTLNTSSDNSLEEL